MRPELYLVLTAVFWSSGGLFIKLVQLGPFAVTGMRSAIATLVLLLFYRKIPRLRSSTDFLGAVAYALTVISFVVATKLSTAANAIFLQSTAPLYVALLGAWFLGEKLKWRDFRYFAVVAIGMSLFFVGSLSGATLLGNLVGLGSGLFFALFILAMRKEAGGTPLEVIICGNILATLLCLPFVFEQVPTARDLWGLLFLGCLQLALPYFLYTRAVRHVKALDASLIFLLEPILNPIWVFLVLGERPTPWSLVGGALVVSAVTMRQLRGRPRRSMLAPVP